jgi:succinoglycan biosynthesis protein ExoA
VPSQSETIVRPMSPAISVIIPARDEAQHIERCLQSVMAQDLAEGFEVIVADSSKDGTAALAEQLGARVVMNPDEITPAALNRALAAARGDIVVRFDAHAEMPPGYLAACVSALTEEEGVVNVGGWRAVVGDGAWGHAMGAALASRFGVGNARIWRRPGASEARRDVDTVPLGCWRAATLRQAGGWNEKFVRNQDEELNYRLRVAGGRVVFDPRIWSIYRPRESPIAIARQYWGYGKFKAMIVASEPRSLRPRQLAPLGLVGVVAAAAIPSPVAPAARVTAAAYGVVLAGVTAKSHAGWRTAVVLPIMHVVWAVGLIVGLARHALPSDAELEVDAD